MGRNPAMGNLMDNYPVGMHECDRLGLNGYCNEDCPRLASEEMVRFREECYPYGEYLVIKNKSDMSAVKHLEVQEDE